MSTSEQPDVLRVAVPNKGALSQAAVGDPPRVRLPPAQRLQGARRLVHADNGVEFFYLRRRTVITLYVARAPSTSCWPPQRPVRDFGATAVEVRELASAAAASTATGRYSSLEELEGLRIATSYVGIVGLPPSGGSGPPSPASTGRSRRASSSAWPT